MSQFTSNKNANRQQQQQSSSFMMNSYKPSAAGSIVASGSVPTMQQVPPVALCFGCLHSFPQQQHHTNSQFGSKKRQIESSSNGDQDSTPNQQQQLGTLHEAPFGENLRGCLHSLRLHSSRVEPLNDRSRESVAGMEDDLKKLVMIIEEELVDRKKNADKLSVQLKYYSEWEGQIQKQLRLVLEEQQRQIKNGGGGGNSLQSSTSQSARNGGGALANSPRNNQGSSSLASAHTSHLLERFLAAARSAAPEERPSSRARGYGTNITNRYGETISRIPRRPDGINHETAAEMAANLPSMSQSSRTKVPNAPMIGKRAASMDEGTLQVFNAVSASIYQILEALSVTTRSAIGALWLHTDDSGDELSAPFLVLGRNDGFSRKGVSGEGALPFRVGATSSTVGAVAGTGIAVSIRRPNGSGTEETLQQALTSTVRSTLIVPVFRKFHATERVCDGAIQLIAWAHSSPFTQDDEFHAVAAANFISHIVSNFSAQFRQVWSSRPPFDPTQLRKIASYNSALDQAVGDVKDAFSTAAAVGHTTGGGTLIHRTDFGHTPAGSSKATIMRQELRAAGNSASSTLVAPKDAVRDIQRYTQTLESSWKSAVLSLGDSEKRVLELQRQLDLAKQHGVIDGSTSGNGGGGASSSSATSGLRSKMQQQQQHQNNVTSTSSPVPPTPTVGATRNTYSSNGRRGSSTATQVASQGMHNFAMSANKLEELEADTKNRMRSAANVKGSVGKSTVFLTEQD